MTILQRLGEINADIENARRAAEFANYVRLIVAARGDVMQAAKLAEAQRATARIGVVLKTAVAAGTTSTSDWAAPLAEYDGLVQAFLESLRNVGAFDAMLPSMRRIPLRTRAVVTTVGISAATITEGHVTPISRLTLAGNQLAEAKAVAIVVVNDELARLGGAESVALFGRELRQAIAAETDRTFVAKISESIAPIASNGGTAIAIRQDIAAALAALNTDAASRLFVLIEASTAKAWATKTTQDGAAAFPGMTPQGGEICGMPAIVSDGLTAGTIVVVDASQIAAGAGTVEVDASKQASLQMETTPDSPPSATTVALSLWQQNMTGLKALRFFGAERLRDAAVAVVSGVTYSGNSPE